MVHRYCDGVVPSPDAAMLAREPEAALRSALDGLVGRVRTCVESFQFSQALRETWDVIGATNRYIVTREPWSLAKDAARRADLEAALYVAADAVRVIAELLRPFMPGTGERMLEMVGVAPSPQSWVGLRSGALAPGSRLGTTQALFPRIERSVEELRTMSSDPSQPAPPPEPPAPPAPGAPSTSAAATAPAAPADAPRIGIDDFMKVELRVAKVLAAERVPKSNKLLKLHVDVGTEQRTLVAGIAEAYEPEAMVGRTVVMVFNLKPAKLMGIESNGMVLAASPEGGKPTLLGFDEPPAPGTRVR
jgi:methionyl-tRNA synthetase